MFLSHPTYGRSLCHNLSHVAFHMSRSIRPCIGIGILLLNTFQGTRFRPLSLDIPKPLFPIAGFPLVQHHIEACSRVEGLREILLIGFFQPTEQLNRFIREMKEQFNLKIRYLQEYALLGKS